MDPLHDSNQYPHSVNTVTRSDTLPVTPNDQAVFAAPDRREGTMGIIPPDGEWLSVEEARVSPKCKNVIAWEKGGGPVLGRSKMTWLNLVVLMQLKS